MKTLRQVYESLSEGKYPTYQGPPLEKGGTSISAGAVPELKYLVSSGFLKKGQKILDFGAGKYGRNTLHLKSLGFDVTAVDKFNYNEKFGVRPEESIKGLHFDVAFTTYVLNVVPESIEDEVIETLESVAGTQAHITRGGDLIAYLKGAAQRKGYTYKWISENIPGHGIDEEVSRYLKGKFKSDDLLALARFGFATVRGFQRLPSLEDKGFSLEKSGTSRVYFRK
jgi:hypothetical protein